MFASSFKQTHTTMPKTRIISNGRFELHIDYSIVVEQWYVSIYSLKRGGGIIGAPFFGSEEQVMTYVDNILSIPSK